MHVQAALLAHAMLRFEHFRPHVTLIGPDQEVVLTFAAAESGVPRRRRVQLGAGFLAVNAQRVPGTVHHLQVAFTLSVRWAAGVFLILVPNIGNIIARK